MAFGPTEAMFYSRWAAYVWQKRPAFVRADVRRRKMLAGHYKHMHYGVAHSLRSLNAEMIRTPLNKELLADQAARLAREFKIGMCNLLQLPPEMLNCSLKMYTPAPDGSLMLATWTRSNENRPKRARVALTAKSSTIYAALKGEADDHVKWAKHSCFCCNDLDKYGARFTCTRPGYREYYRSTLVFAVRQRQRGKNGPATEIGFLAFDSPQENAFVDMPEVFDFYREPDKYRQKCDSSATFHLGATYADMWGTVMQCSTTTPEPDAGGDA